MGRKIRCYSNWYKRFIDSFNGYSGASHKARFQH